METLDDARYRRATRAIQSRSSPDYSFETSSKTAQRHQFLVGLTVAGLASTLLTSIYELFSVDIFLRVYDLPLSLYATGNFVFFFISTANKVVGAWIVDAFAHESSRSSIIGSSGCIFAVCFLSPFFRWQASRESIWDGSHFVFSMSLYDSLLSFTSIIMGSLVTDDHAMSDDERIRFMASGKMVNLVASFMVARIGLEVFSDDDMSSFRLFIVIVCLLACVLFSIAQLMMTPEVTISWRTFSYRRKPARKAISDNASSKKRPVDKPKRRLRLRRVIQDFWMHENFRAWIGMEMLLECENSFVTSFLKTFIDRLVVDAGGSREACDWLLSLLSPMKQIAAIICYVPIRRRGYRKVYNWMFWANLILSVLCLTVASPSRPYLIILFLFVHTVMTGAVQSAGFHLAMSDMVLDMKRKHASEGRIDEPSLAGMFLGANSLLCKPMESALPIVAAFFLGETDFSSNEQSEDARWVLFYLLVVPPILFSCLQLLSWRGYNLHPERTGRMREELDKLLATSEYHNEA